MNGWVKLHRCTLNKAIWQNQNLWRVFCWCLLKATHKEIEQMVGMTKVVLQPGQFIYGRSKASEETGIKQTTLTDCMEWLKNNNTIAINPTTKYSLITIINWELYQSEESESDNKATTTRQQSDTNKKVKNIKNIYSPIFEKFYSAYPRHEGRDDAEKAWRKIKESEHEAIFNALSKYKIAVAGKEKQYIKMPASWLNSKRWKDEIETSQPQQTELGKEFWRGAL